MEARVVRGPDGARPASAPGGSAQPAAEWTRVTVRASSGLSGGKRPGSRSASIVLPEPGGPMMSRLVRAGGGHLEGAPAEGLAALVGEIVDRPGVDLGRAGGGGGHPH